MHTAGLTREPPRHARATARTPASTSCRLRGSTRLLRWIRLTALFRRTKYKSGKVRRGW